MARASPKRTKKSPGRPKKSPGRPKKSPGRPKKSPGRPKKSPGRPKKSPEGFFDRFKSKKTIEREKEALKGHPQIMLMIASGYFPPLDRRYPQYKDEFDNMPGDKRRELIRESKEIINGMLTPQELYKNDYPLIWTVVSKLMAKNLTSLPKETEDTRRAGKNKNRCPPRRPYLCGRKSDIMSKSEAKRDILFLFGGICADSSPKEASCLQELDREKLDARMRPKSAKNGVDSLLMSPFSLREMEKMNNGLETQREREEKIRREREEKGGEGSEGFFFHRHSPGPIRRQQTNLRSTELKSNDSSRKRRNDGKTQEITDSAGERETRKNRVGSEDEYKSANLRRRKEFGRKRTVTSPTPEVTLTQKRNEERERVARIREHQKRVGRS